MRIALTHNLRLTESEEEAEFDTRETVDALAGAIEPGGIACFYLPTTVQVQQLVLALPAAGFRHLETFETLHRSWHVTERSVRPDHRMVAHTGFLTVARLVGR
jgi:tRNA (adenine57-N1/adenine58-N1)-methyltransferase